MRASPIRKLRSTAAPQQSSTRAWGVAEAPGPGAAPEASTSSLSLAGRRRHPDQRSEGARLAAHGEAGGTFAPNGFAPAGVRARSGSAAAVPVELTAVTALLHDGGSQALFGAQRVQGAMRPALAGRRQGVLCRLGQGQGLPLLAGAQRSRGAAGSAGAQGRGKKPFALPSAGAPRRAGPGAERGGREQEAGQGSAASQGAGRASHVLWHARDSHDLLARHRQLPRRRAQRLPLQGQAQELPQGLLAGEDARPRADSARARARPRCGKRPLAQDSVPAPLPSPPAPHAHGHRSSRAAASASTAAALRRRAAGCGAARRECGGSRHSGRPGASTAESRAGPGDAPSEAGGHRATSCARAPARVRAPWPGGCSFDALLGKLLPGMPATLVHAAASRAAVPRWPSSSCLTRSARRRSTGGAGRRPMVRARRPVPPQRHTNSRAGP